MQEFQRICNSCGKVWHSLISRENQIASSSKVDALNVCAQMCNASAQAQSKRNMEANQSELARLRQCPNCGSVNYREFIIDHSRPPQMPPSR